jgi:hypothetical protein
MDADELREERKRKVLERAAKFDGPALPPQFESSVVGVTFAPDYPQSVIQLEIDHMMFGDRDERMPALLIRNPDNEYDSNAIEVHSPGAGHIIGHLPKALAMKLAPRLDAGEIWQAEFTEVRVSDEAPDRPGIGVSIHRIHEEDQ